MTSFFDRFRNPDKMRVREEQRAQREINDVAAREALAEQRRAHEAAARLREEERIAGSDWTYQDITDDMRGTTMSMAQLISENSVEFAFPYDGGCQGMLVIRRRSNQLELVFTVTNGQFDAVIGDHSISTKIDDGPVQQRIGTQPDQGSANLMFIDGSVQFIRSFQQADRVIVEAQFYQHGSAQFKFNVAGLDARFQIR